MLKILKLKASIGDKEILKGVDLAVGRGEIHVLMGPNGSGKSTLAQVIAGHPGYKVNGKLLMVNRDITKLTPDKRAKLGIFLGFQHPVEVPGVSVFAFLRKAKSSLGPVRSFLPASARSGRKPNGKGRDQSELRAVGNPSTSATQTAQFREELLEYASSLKLSDDFLRRSLNEGFSGGEKKRNEILQMMALKPKLVILDEIDSGLDIDGLKLIAKAIKQFTVDPLREASSSQSSVILITHYARILKYLKPDFVHVMVDGKIIKSGKMSLAQKIEEKGYEVFTIESSRLRSNNIST